MKKHLLTILMLIPVFVYAQVNLNLGLKAHYTFSGNANDASGSGFHGTPQGGIQLTTDRFGVPNSAYQFDGIDDRIIVSDNGGLSTPSFSITYYFMTESNAYQNCIGKINYADGNAATYNSGIFPTGMRPYFGTIGSSGNCFQQVPGTLVYTIFSPVSIVLNQWNCVVNTFDNGVEKLYLNGALVSQSTTPFNNATFCTNTNFVIGSWWQSDPFRFKGKMDDIRFYNRAINQEEVNALCQVPSSPPCNQWTTQPGNIISTKDTTICKGSSLQLATVSALEFCWTPDTYLNNSSVQNPISTPPSNITYYFNAQVEGTNIIINGDFNAGNTGFNSSYVYSPVSGINAGVYNIGNNLPSWHNSMPACSDHTSGNGNMMIVNGAEFIDVVVWSQNVTVSPNTNYALSTWLQHITTASLNPAELQFAINGVPVGPVFRANNNPCLWEKFYTIWNSGGSTSALISIVNQNSQFSGNDFALDDISFSPIRLLRDSIIINVEDPNVRTNSDTTVCAFTQIQLTTTGAISYQWSPVNGLSNPNIGNPSIIPNSNTQFIVTGLTSNGCIGKDTFNLVIKPLPNIQTIADTSFCGPHSFTLSASGGSSYSWSPAAGLSNSGIANPVFSGSSPQVYTYYVTGTGANLCTAKDSVKIIIYDQPVVNTVSNTAICSGDALQLISTSNAQTNQWQPAGSVSNAGTLSPNFVGTTTQMVYLTGSNGSGCFAKDSVLVTVKPKPNVQTIADTSFCGPHSFTLSASGGSSYSWSPAAGLSNSGIANPVFSGSSPQVYTYYVTGTGANLCTAKDSVKIIIYDQPVANTVSNTAICSGDALQLISTSNAQTNQWQPAGAVSNAGTLSPNFVGTITQMVYLTGINTSGCSAKDSVLVTVKPAPNVQTISDTTTCAVNSLVLMTTGAQAYSWSPASGLDNPLSPNPIFTGTGSYTYYVTGTAANGCTAKDSVKVTIGNKPVFTAPAGASICAKEAVQLDGNNGNAYQYSWSPATYLNNTSIANPIANPQVTITYSLTIKDVLCDADSTFSVLVAVRPSPAVRAVSSNDIDCSNAASQLNVIGAQSYEWTPSSGLNSAGISSPVASPVQSTQYIVTGTDANGCTGKDTLLVSVKGGQYFSFGIPNSFTPNGDGKNDCFGITKWGVTTGFHLVVYSRWGEKVFETRDQSTCWDGKWKGKPADAGNYIFYLKGNTACGSINKKGNVILIR